MPRKYTCKYLINENFFKNIQTEIQAYWLGFIMADGYIGDRYLQIRLSYKDVYHLLQFREDIQSTHPLKIKFMNEKYPVAQIQFTNKQMINDLNCLGLNSNKTGNECFAHGLPKNLYRHYIRGYFDGDGNLHISKRNNGKYKSSIRLSFTCASLNFLLEIQNILIEKCNLNKIQIFRNKKQIYYYRLEYQGNNQCNRIIKYLWNHSNIYLPRKIIPILESGLLEKEIELNKHI